MLEQMGLLPDFLCGVNLIYHLSSSSLSHCQLLLASLFAPEHKFLTSKFSPPGRQTHQQPHHSEKLHTRTLRDLPQPHEQDPLGHLASAL